MEKKLLTPELQQKFADYPLYSQDGKKKDALCIALFFIGNIRWYILEGQKEGEDFTAYGIVCGLQNTEYGYISMNELENVTLKPELTGLPVELRVMHDKRFQPQKIGNIQDSELKAFLHGLYD